MDRMHIINDKEYQLFLTLKKAFDEKKNTVIIDQEYGAFMSYETYTTDNQDHRALKLIDGLRRDNIEMKKRVEDLRSENEKFRSNILIKLFA